MSEFNKIWVNCVEDENLYEKYGFFADSIESLKSIVTEDNLRYWGMLSHRNSNRGDFPFVKQEEDRQYRFFYHDPTLSSSIECPPDKIVTNYSLKEADGETLEVNTDDMWTGVTKKNHRIVTYKELAKWLATGHGQVRNSSGDNAKIYVFGFGYSEELDDKPVENVLVRTWNDVTWNAPTAYYLGLLENN